MLQRFFILIAVVLLNVNIDAQDGLLGKYKSNPNYEVKLFEDSTIEINDKAKNYRWLKSIADLPVHENTTDANLIISLDTISFAAYNEYYRLWGELPATNTIGKYTALDANENGKNEIYTEYVHREDPFNLYSSVRIYEQSQDSIFSFIYEFPIDTLGDVFDVGDITGDGLLDISCRGTKNNIRCFKQNSSNDLIIHDNFNYNPFPIVYQPNDVALYDIDGDGNLEMIYFLAAGSLDSVWAGSNHVAKYNPQINNYELIYYNRPQPEYFTSGISTGDFDQDGKGNFATGSIGGKFYIYEYIQGTQYQLEFTKELETYNAFLTIMTDDMDGNGKPEIWIGGDFGSSIYGGITRLFAFEASAPGVYNQVYQIDIRGLFSAIYGKLRYTDLDGDGIKELFLTNANLAFGFKYDGNGNYYMDFVKSMPVLDSIYVFQDLERVDIADLDGDGIVEIIPQYLLNKGWQESWEKRSIFLKRDKLTGVDAENIIYPTGYNLLQNFPNPFNPQTKIKYVVSSESKISIRIYNTLGKEIKVLLSETRNHGEYEITWDGTDNFGNKVSSGVYFITMEANNFSKNSLPFRKTIKSIFLK
ncbi:MAG: T9SS type A sorting domain-containing protein [Ignavibacteriaceae bacterium]|nr:T9SS type A sorting domain-containing protein [Ignavibacteriaceae bacterium]